MTGFNLPPGCSVSDIPGNRPEDEAYEHFWGVSFPDALKVARVEIPNEWWDNDQFIQAVDEANVLGFATGYEECKQDAAFDARYGKETE